MNLVRPGDSSTLGSASVKAFKDEAISIASGIQYLVKLQHFSVSFVQAVREIVQAQCVKTFHKSTLSECLVTLFMGCKRLVSSIYWIGKKQVL